jgi:hypothetical protein
VKQFFDFSKEADGQKGFTSQVEEVVSHPNWTVFEYLFPNTGKRFLQN